MAPIFAVRSMGSSPRRPHRTGTARCQSRSLCSSSNVSPHRIPALVTLPLPQDSDGEDYETSRELERALQLQAATRAEQAENLADNAHRNDNRDTDGNGPYLEHFAQLLSQRNYVNDMGNDLDEVRLRGLLLPNAGTAVRLHAWGSGACSVVSCRLRATQYITHVILAMR